MTVVIDFLRGVGARDGMEYFILAVLITGTHLDGHAWGEFCDAFD